MFITITAKLADIQHAAQRSYPFLSDDSEGEEFIICKQNIFLHSPLLCATQWAVNRFHLLRL